jgi:hypothetical protein
MENLIIGGITNYDYGMIKPWVESICEVSPTSHKVMCVGQISEETRDKLIEKGFELFEMPKANVPVHVLRFLAIYEYLRTTDRKINYVVTTDVRDVYFQRDPFEYLENNLKTHSLIASSESIRYKDEEWGNENLYQAYGQYVHNLFKNNEIYNVGVLAGKMEYIKDLVFNIFTNGINRPIPIVDQAVYNVLIQTQPYRGVVDFSPQRSGWAVQLGTTGDQSKIDRFRPHLTEPEPILDYENGLVKTCDGQPFYIVHQYDRVREWKKFYEEKYGVKIKSQYTPDDEVIVINTGV